MKIFAKQKKEGKEKKFCMLSYFSILLISNLHEVIFEIKIIIIT